MISMAYDKTAKRFVSSGEMSASFWLGAGKKRNITAGRQSWSKSARPEEARGQLGVTREWRRKPSKKLKIGSQMACRRLRSFW
jgi:hypothetical protein